MRTLEPSKLSNLRAYSSSAASPRSRTAARIGATMRSASSRRAVFRSISAAAFLAVSIRIIALMSSHYDFVERIFHDALRACALEPRNNRTHGGLFENGVHRQPAVFAQR